MVERERNITRREHTGIKSGLDRSNVPVLAAVEQVGFSSRFADRLRELNNALGTIAAPRVEGFNLELFPDKVAPFVDVKLDVKNPFKVDIMGEGGYAAVRVRNNTTVEMHIADVQEFTRSTFRNRKIALWCLPRRYSEEGIWAPYTKIPTSFYEEEQYSHWQSLLEEDYSRKRTARDREMFFPIKMDLYESTEELLANLERSPGDKGSLIFDVAKAIDKLANFPYDKFQIYLSREKRPLFEFFGNISRLYKPIEDTEGVPSFIFSQLYFRGKHRDVEKVIDKFTELLKKTPQYQKATTATRKEENTSLEKLPKARRQV